MKQLFQNVDLLVGASSGKTSNFALQDRARTSRPVDLQRTGGVLWSWLSHRNRLNTWAMLLCNKKLETIATELVKRLMRKKSYAASNAVVPMVCCCLLQETQVVWFLECLPTSHASEPKQSIMHVSKRISEKHASGQTKKPCMWTQPHRSVISTKSRTWPNATTMLPVLTTD
jgi:hypothetical protein